MPNKPYQFIEHTADIGIKKRIGLNYKNRGKFLTQKIDIEDFDNKHVVEYYLDLLRLLDINILQHTTSPKIYASAKSVAFGDRFLEENNVSKTDLLIGMAPGCGESWGQDAYRRRWGLENFAGLANALIDKKGAKIVLLGNQKEADICVDVLSLTKSRAINYCGKTSIEDLAGILGKCRLVITNEGGLLHMAVGLGVKTVSLFGPVDEKSYGPYFTEGVHIVVSRKDLPCRSCYKKFKYNDCGKRLCLEMITVDEVFQAAEEALKR